MDANRMDTLRDTDGKSIRDDSRDEATIDGFEIRPVNKYGLIDVVLKIVERCNLACPYCYFFFSGDETYKRHPPTIPKKTVDDLIAYLRDAVLNHGIRLVKIGLHGGEPLMMKKTEFATMCARFRAELGPHCRLIITMQTNGILLDEEWISIFNEHGVRVGVSMDGPKHINDLTRIDKKGRGSYDESRRGWELLKKATEEGRMPAPGMLCVVQPQHSGAEIFRHFAEEMRAPAVNFLLPDITHDSPEATPEFIAGCGKYMIDVYKAWAASDGKCVVRFIYEASGPMMDDESCRRSVNGKYDPLGLMVVSSNGEICPDDVMRGVDERFRDTGIRLDTHNIASTLESAPWKALEEAQANPPAACKECVWFNACRGGSPQNRYSKANGFNNPSVFCSVLKEFHAYVASSLVVSGYDVKEIERRLESTWVATGLDEATIESKEMFA